VLNEALLRILPALLEKGIQTIHQTGNDHYDAVKTATEEYGIRQGESGYAACPFLPVGELADALAFATIVISRAGAGSIAEIAAAGKPAILVPLASAANDEQRMNAYDIAEIGGALVIEEANLGKNMLLEKIIELIDHPEIRKSMGEKVRAFYHPDAADAIASSLSALIMERRS
jgi:UDP-N-acetylglucosamine--N-acetylmuramyl-(pentapeptide) pyrophosphoryl-undecaprenol N-acetylglucosamine transferase